MAADIRMKIARRVPDVYMVQQKLEDSGRLV
jgi:hypothetical protein